MITGELGLANAIHELRTDLGLHEPLLGDIKNTCRPDQVEQVRSWLDEVRQAARDRLLDVSARNQQLAAWGG